ncbi:UNVERIFIED_CONTAM: hypothetical protein GTU68_013004 [Idotea baltica]|nr:hypothetical protein [Idotea baltica]
MYGENTLLEVEELCVSAGSVPLLRNVSLHIDRGEILGLVGESGSGKSLTALSIMGLLESPPMETTSGRIHFNDLDILKATDANLEAIRGNDVAMIFQEPMTSLNPVFTIGDQRVGGILAEPLKVHRVGNKADQRRRVAEILALVGLPADATTRYAHEFSGGQRQRIAIARALVLNPKFLVADEAVSALDVSIQSQIINLLNGLQKQLGITMLFISHDLSVIRHVCDRIAVMYLGRIVETGTITDVLDSPQHPYTQALVSAVPNPAKRHEQRIVLKGELPNAANPPSGCHFNTRCAAINQTVQEQCSNPGYQTCGQSACHRYPNDRVQLACHLIPSPYVNHDVSLRNQL